MDLSDFTEHRLLPQGYELDELLKKGFEIIRVVPYNDVQEAYYEEHPLPHTDKALCLRRDVRLKSARFIVGRRRVDVLEKFLKDAEQYRIGIENLKGEARGLETLLKMSNEALESKTNLSTTLQGLYEKSNQTTEMLEKTKSDLLVSIDALSLDLAESQGLNDLRVAEIEALRTEIEALKVENEKMKEDQRGTRHVDL